MLSELRFGQSAFTIRQHGHLVTYNVNGRIQLYASSVHVYRAKVVWKLGMRIQTNVHVIVSVYPISFYVGEPDGNFFSGEPIRLNDHVSNGG